LGLIKWGESEFIIEEVKDKEGEVIEWKNVKLYIKIIRNKFNHIGLTEDIDKLENIEKEFQELKEKYDKLVEQVQRDECYDCEYRVKL
jgi:uncharacterized FAD-dependent dehydrogenase